MNALLRGCLAAAIALVALLGFGVTLCGVIIAPAPGSGGGGLILIGVLLIVIPLALLFVVLRGVGGKLDRVLRVAVYRDGRITANGEVLTPEILRARLDKLRSRDGIVWLYREGTEGDRHPNAALVARAIGTARVPVSLSSRPDFSDELRADGTTRPRLPSIDT